MNLRELPQYGSVIHALRPDRALSLHLPGGATVSALSGIVWLTQDGMSQDVLLAPGERYEVQKKGHLVLNALGRSASVYIELPLEPRSSRISVTPELVSAIEAKARRLRQQEISRMLKRAGEWVVSAVRALKVTLHRSMSQK